MTDIQGRIASIALAIPLSLIATFDAQADDSKKLEAAEARARTLAERVQALEAKTNYFTKTTRRVRKIFRPNTPRATWTCDGPYLTLQVDANGQGTFHVWPKLVVTYRAPQPEQVIGFSLSTVDPSLPGKKATKKGAEPCADETELGTGTGGSTTYTDFCSYDVNKGEVFEFTFWAYAPSVTAIDACDAIRRIDLTLKMVQIEIAEPPDR